MGKDRIQTSFIKKKKKKPFVPMHMAANAAMENAA